MAGGDKLASAEKLELFVRGGKSIVFEGLGILNAELLDAEDGGAVFLLKLASIIGLNGEPLMCLSLRVMVTRTLEVAR